MKYILFIIIFLFNSVAKANEKSDQQLFDELAQMDSLLFENAKIGVTLLKALKRTSVLLPIKNRFVN